MFRHFSFQQAISRRTLLVMASLGLAAAIFPVRAAFAAERRNILILFYSRSGNTRTFAKEIQRRTGGELVELAPVEDYPADYNACTAQAKKELAAGVFPDIRPVSANLADYDVIFVGSPNWWSSWSCPVRTFLHQNALEGKTVIPFNTNGGGGWGHMLADLKKFCPKAKIREGLELSGGSVAGAGGKIDSWLKSMGLMR